MTSPWVAEGRFPIDQEEQKKSEERIASLARELAEAINEGGAPGRTEARDYAIDLLRDEVETEVIASPEPRPGDGQPGSMNPFGLGIPLVVLGVLLMPLFGIMGLAIAAIGIFMCLVGVGMAITQRLRKDASEPG